MVKLINIDRVDGNGGRRQIVEYIVGASAKADEIKRLVRGTLSTPSESIRLSLSAV